MKNYHKICDQKNNCAKKVQWSGHITVFTIGKKAKKMDKIRFLTGIDGLFQILTANLGFYEEF